MKQKNNNASKDTESLIFPDEFRKCFFVLENKISDVEMAFIRHHIKERTNIRFKFDDSIYRLGLEFLLFFFQGIRPILTNFGTTLADSLIAKFKESIAKYQ